ncbi:MAG: hypothetical protein IKC38_03895 [Clostridia bacterium]|nr:hypothetical protein [Clostridia bacterium]
MSDILDAVKKDEIYEDAIGMMFGEAVEPYEYAIMRLETILGWRDADAKIEECYAKIREIKDRKAQEANEAKERANQEKEQQRTKAAKDAKQGRIIAAVIAVVVIAALVWGISALVKLFTQTIPNNKYESAMTLIAEGDYLQAYDILIGLKDFKDSKAQAESILLDCKKQTIREAEVGSYIKFGKYEQDNDTSNGGEDIEWLVLAREGHKVLVISRYGLEHLAYNQSNESCTWETCSLRQWLNGDFYSGAFSDWEKEFIPVTTVTAEDNASYNQEAGNDTQDHVFLLSIGENNTYFKNLSGSNRLKGTDYTNEKMHKTASNYLDWWLRSPGYNSVTAAFVNGSGGVKTAGYGVDDKFCAVRPAMWIEME